MSEAYFGTSVPDVHRRFYLHEVLHRIDHWTSETDGQFSVSALAAPDIGNPFGVVIDGTRVDAGAPYRHYCAQRVSGFLDPGASTVVEIGGGFGGMAYYLLRDGTPVRYCGFDVPETIALASYYLIKAFPQRTFGLYAEDAADSDVVLLPLFELPRFATAGAQVVFSSHAVSDMSREALTECLDHIARISQHYFLQIGVERPGESISDLIDQRFGDRFTPAETRRSAWNDLKASGKPDVERLYSVSHIRLQREAGALAG